LIRLVEADGPQVRRTRQDAESALRAEIDRHSLPAFPRAIVTRDPETAVPVLLQAYGLGPVRANTVLINWFDRRKGDTNPVRMRNFGRRLRLALRFSCNLVVLSASASDFEAVQRTKRRDRVIDVWHRDNATGKLSLLLAYLMTRSEPWEDARIRLIAPQTKEGSKEETLATLVAMLDDVRIAADVEIVDAVDSRAVVRCSAGSSVVFLPMALADEGPTCVYGPLEQLLPELGLTSLVLAAQDIVLDTEPEGGEHAEIAQAIDDAKKAAKTVRKVGVEAEKAAEEARETQAKLEAAREQGADVEEIADLESAAREAGQEAERSKRRAAKAQAKADTAAEEARIRTGGGAAKDGYEPRDNGR
jgi:hypothetical protein